MRDRPSLRPVAVRRRLCSGSSPARPAQTEFPSAHHGGAAPLAKRVRDNPPRVQIPPPPLAGRGDAVTNVDVYNGDFQGGSGVNLAFGHNEITPQAAHGGVVTSLAGLRRPYRVVVVAAEARSPSRARQRNRRQWSLRTGYK
jgi:hypothetical protein